MESIVACLIGIIIGCIISKIVCRDKPVGTLRVDISDPDDGPYLFLELSKGVDVIRRKRNVVLKVNTTSYIPHE